MAAAPGNEGIASGLARLDTVMALDSFAEKPCTPKRTVGCKWVEAGAAILVEAALAFIGLAPGRITLGGLLGGDAQTYMYGAPWLILWPGIALALLALAVNLVGEWIAESVSLSPSS